MEMEQQNTTMENTETMSPQDRIERLQATIRDLQNQLIQKQSDYDYEHQFRIQERQRFDDLMTLLRTVFIPKIIYEVGEKRAWAYLNDNLSKDWLDIFADYGIMEKKYKVVDVDLHMRLVVPDTDNFELDRYSLEDIVSDYEDSIEFSEVAEGLLPDEVKDHYSVDNDIDNLDGYFE